MGWPCLPLIVHVYNSYIYDSTPKSRHTKAFAVSYISLLPLSLCTRCSLCLEQLLMAKLKHTVTFHTQGVGLRVHVHDPKSGHLLQFYTIGDFLASP